MFFLYSFITLCALALVFFWIKKKCWVIAPANYLYCIYRFGGFHRSVEAKDRLGKSVILLWPFAEKIALKFDRRVRRISFPIKFDDSEYRIFNNWCIDYKISKNIIPSLIKEKSFLIKSMVDCIRDHSPIISSYLDKQQKQLYMAALQSEVVQQLQEFLDNSGWEIVNAELSECRVVAKQLLDVTYTKKFMQLLSTDAADRDLSWWQQLNSLICKANFYSPNNEEMQPISTSLHAIYVSPFEEFTEDVTPRSLEYFLESCLQKGVGCAITSPEGAEPLLVLSLIQVYALLQNNVKSILFGDAGDGFPPSYDIHATYIPMGDPGEDILPLVLRNAIYLYLKRLNIKAPETTLTVRGGGDFRLLITFNVFREQFDSDSEFNSFLRQFYWFLPENTPLVGVSKQSDIAAEMFPLAVE